MASFTGCNDLPPTAYSLSSDPLPDRAQVLSYDQFQQLSSSGRFFSVTNKSVAEQEQAAAAQEAKDDQALTAYLKQHPGAGRLVPAEPNEHGVSKNHDGSYSHRIKLRHGAQRSVVTLSQRWAKSSAAGSIRRFGTRENQLALYRLLYAAAPERLRSELALPRPEDIAANGKLYDARSILALNDRLAARRHELTAPTMASLAGAPARCSDEEGAGNGSDRSGSQDSNPVCAPAPSGIFASYAFAAKPSLTCVKDQANRGTCVSFAFTSSLESLVARSEGSWMNLSEQALYERAKLVWFRGDFGDGLVSTLLAFWLQTQNWRWPFETGWQYNPADSRQEDDKAKLYHHSCDGYAGTCSDSAHQAELICADKAPYRYCGFYAQTPPAGGFGVADYSEAWDFIDRSAAVARMAAIVQTGSPVVWSFNVTPSWDAAGSDAGFVHYAGDGESNRGGHAVHVVAAIDNADLAQLLPTAPPGSGGGYLIVKNSWSNCWGDGGYVYAPYDFVKAYTTDALTVSRISK